MHIEGVGEYVTRNAAGVITASPLRIFEADVHGLSLYLDPGDASHPADHLEHLVRIEGGTSNQVSSIQTAGGGSYDYSYRHDAASTGGTTLYYQRFFVHGESYGGGIQQYVRLTAAELTAVAPATPHYPGYLVQPWTHFGPLCFILEDDAGIASDVTIHLGDPAYLQGQKFTVLNRSSTRTVWVRGFVALVQSGGGTQVDMDAGVGFPVRPGTAGNGGVLELTPTLDSSRVSAAYRPPHHDLTGYPSAGTWYRGEILYNLPSAYGGTNQVYAKVCSAQGTYGGTAPVWKELRMV
jgi:hypothetical protein